MLAMFETPSELLILPSLRFLYKSDWVKTLCSSDRLEATACIPNPDRPMFVGSNAVPNQSRNVGTRVPSTSNVPSFSETGIEIRLGPRTVFQARGVVLLPAPPTAKRE